MSEHEQPQVSEFQVEPALELSEAEAALRERQLDEARLLLSQVECRVGTARGTDLNKGRGDQVRISSALELVRSARETLDRVEAALELAADPAGKEPADGV